MIGECFVTEICVFKVDRPKSENSHYHTLSMYIINLVELLQLKITSRSFYLQMEGVVLGLVQKRMQTVEVLSILYDLSCD